MTKRTCSVGECGSPVLARSFCRMHYQRWRKHGDPEVSGRRLVSYCTVAECESEVHGNGWCRKHYLRWYKHGDPNYTRPVRELVSCSVEGCDAVERTRGWCVTHYDRWVRNGTTDLFELSEEDRFWAKVDKSGDCWEWQGGRFETGYGSFIFADKQGLAHRYSFNLHNGYFPPEVDHRCHNRGCVNPSHLRPATKKLNMENFTGLSSRNKTGYRGVYESGGRFIATVGHAGSTHHVGSFNTASEAGEAARLKRLELHTYNDLDRIA